MANAEQKIGTAEVEPIWSAGSSAVPSLTPPTTPQILDFCQVTPCQLGITTQSFLPSSQGKDKSRLSQLKGKRRSTIGVRGSPETNSLIRYIAQHKHQTPTGNPQSLQASPFIRSGRSTLKQKMASFQSLMEVEENHPLEHRKETYGSTTAGGKENMGPQSCPHPVAPPPSKRTRMGCLKQDAEESEEVTPWVLTNTQLLTVHQQEQTALSVGSASSVQRSGQMEASQVDGPTPSGPEPTSCETEKSMCLSPLQPPVWQRAWKRDPLPFSLAHCTPTKEQQLQSCFSGPQSPSMLLSVDLEDVRPSQPVPFPSLSPSTTQPATAGEAEPAGNSALLKKKRVHFGAPLSPEFFDKRLPPSTPLQKGGTPAHLPASTGSRLRSVLKTPQRSTPPLPQPNFNSPSVTGASPPFSQQQHATVVRTTMNEDEGKITPPVVAEEARHSREVTDVALLVSTKDMAQCEFQPPDMSPASPHSPSRETETGVDTEPAPAPAPAPVPEQPVSADAPVRPRGRKRKQPDENNAVRKRTSRSAAISASGKMKVSAGKRRWGSKEVDRSLYGKRDYASKNPTLSPIDEALSSTGRSPTPQRRRSATKLPAEGDGNGAPVPSVPMPDAGQGGPGTGVLIAAAMWRRRFCLHAWESEVNGDLPDDSHSPGSSEDVTSESSAISAASATDCTATALSALQLPVSEKKVEERVGKVGRPRGRGRGKGRKESAMPCANSLEMEDMIRDNDGTKTDREYQTDVRAESSVCSPARPTDPPGNSLETNTDSSPAHTRCTEGPKEGSLIGSDTSGEGDGHTHTHDPHCDIHWDVDGRAAPECNSVHCMQSDGGQEFERSGDKLNKGRRGGVPSRPRGRRSSLIRPQFIMAEDEPQGPQADIASAPEQREVMEDRRQEGSHVSARRMEEEAMGEGEVTEVPDRDGQSGPGCLDAFLPPWQQAEFSIEDVLQPLPKGRRSVRRSLRNQSQQDPSAAGLAWVPHTSPTSRRSTGGARRGTRGRPRGRPSTTSDALSIPEEPGL